MCSCLLRTLPGLQPQHKFEASLNISPLIESIRTMRPNNELFIVDGCLNGQGPMQAPLHLSPENEIRIKKSDCKWCCQWDGWVGTAWLGGILRPHELRNNFDQLSLLAQNVGDSAQTWKTCSWRWGAGDVSPTLDASLTIVELDCKF